MAIVDYGPLWETMERNNVTQYQLLQSGIDKIGRIDLQRIGNIKEYIEREPVGHVRRFDRADKGAADAGSFRQLLLR